MENRVRSTHQPAEVIRTPAGMRMLSAYRLSLQLRSEPDFRIRHYGDVPCKSLITLGSHNNRMFSRRELQVDRSVANKIAIHGDLSIVRCRGENHRTKRRLAWISRRQRGLCRHGFGWRD